MKLKRKLPKSHNLL